METIIKPGYMPEAKSEEWGTPRAVFDPLNSEFKFTVDVAARPWNAKIPDRFFQLEQNGLAQSWAGETAWCNPPYGSENITQWLTKAHLERERGTTTVLLLPNTTDTKWFHKFVWDVRSNRARPGIELRFIAGRIKFDLPPELSGTVKANANVKGSILVIVRPSLSIFNLCPHCGK